MEPLLGTIVMFAGNFEPRGWAFCNGQLMSISQNTALFSILGTTYGGDGVTTFALPDLRGRAPIHAGQGPGLSNYALGESAGSESVTLRMGGYGSQQTENPVSALAGVDQPVSLIQPVLAVNYIIALEGIYPSRN